MLRGYRSIIAAACGLVLLVALGTGAFFGSLYGPDRKHYETVAGEQPGQSDYAGPSQSMPDIAGLPAPVERAIANPRPPSGQDHEKRDLAAQEASALWAFWMVVASFASVLITSVGTILLYRQIVLTREAVEGTGKATEAMERQNEIAEDNSKRQLRAYVGVIGIEVRFDPRGRQDVFFIEVQNSGQTPAYDLWVSGAYEKISGDPNKIRLFATLADRHSKLTINSNAKYNLSVPIKPYSDVLEFDHFVIFGMVRYKDAFGRMRRTLYRYWITKQAVESSRAFCRKEGSATVVGLLACSKGNRAN